MFRPRHFIFSIQENLGFVAVTRSSNCVASVRIERETILCLSLVQKSATKSHYSLSTVCVPRILLINWFYTKCWASAGQFLVFYFLAFTLNKAQQNNGFLNTKRRFYAEKDDFSFLADRWKKMNGCFGFSLAVHTRSTGLMFFIQQKIARLTLWLGLFQSRTQLYLFCFAF